MHSSMCPTVHGLGFVHCGQIAWKKWPTNWHAHVSRWLMLSCHWQLWVLLPMCLFDCLLVFSFVKCCPPISPFHGSDHWWTNIFCWWNIHKSVGSYLYSKLHHLYVRRTWHILQWPRFNICRYCIAWLSIMSSSTHKVRPQRWPLCNF